jgi:hypothetical protein
MVPKGTPSAVSLGKRCRREGYKFAWEPFGEREVFTPDGADIELDIANDVPFLPAWFVAARSSVAVMPSLASVPDREEQSSAEDAAAQAAHVEAPPAPAPCDATSEDGSEKSCKIPADHSLA